MNAHAIGLDLDRRRAATSSVRRRRTQAIVTAGRRRSALHAYWKQYRGRVCSRLAAVTHDPATQEIGIDPVRQP
jgi:hypothetical protein